MASGSQRDPNRHPVLCWANIELMAKVFTAIEGRKVARIVKGLKGGGSERAMGASDLFLEAVSEKVRDVKPSPRALAKCKKLLERGRSRNESASWHAMTDEEKTKSSNKRMMAYYRRKIPADRKKLAEAKKKGASEKVIATLKRRLSESEAGLKRYEEICRTYTDARRKGGA